MFEAHQSGKSLSGINVPTSLMIGEDVVGCKYKHTSKLNFWVQNAREGIVDVYLTTTLEIDKEVVLLHPSVKFEQLHVRRACAA